MLAGLGRAFIEKHYSPDGKRFRRCHPRDVITHAIDIIHFEKLPMELTEEVLDRAFESCFLQEAQAEAAAIAPAAASEPARTESPIMPVMSQTCSDYWGDQVDQINTAFGTLAFIAAFRNRATGSYHDVDSSRQYGETETSRVLEKLHVRAFQSWLSLNFDQQKRDVARYLAAEGGSFLNGDYRDLVAQLTPAAARAEDLQRLSQYLAAILDALLPKPEPAKTESPAGFERIA